MRMRWVRLKGGEHSDCEWDHWQVLDAIPAGIETAIPSLHQTPHLGIPDYKTPIYIHQKT